jgi:hypothetical protein
MFLKIFHNQKCQTKYSKTFYIFIFWVLKLKMKWFCKFSIATSEKKITIF